MECPVCRTERTEGFAGVRRCYPDAAASGTVKMPAVRHGSASEHTVVSDVLPEYGHSDN